MIGFSRPCASHYVNVFSAGHVTASPLLRAVVRGTPDTGRAKEQAQVNCSALHDWLDGNRRGELTGLAVEGTQLGKLVQSRQHAQQAHWVLTLGATHRSAR